MPGPLNNTAPPITNFQEVWNLFEFAISSGLGFSIVIGIVFLAILEFIILIKKGPRVALLALLVLVPLISFMGLFPSWIRLITYVVATIIGAWWYVRSTEGV